MLSPKQTKKNAQENKWYFGRGKMKENKNLYHKSKHNNNTNSIMQYKGANIPI